MYATGNAFTPTIGRYMIEGRVISEFGERNSFRMASYHRMDISATWYMKKGEKFEHSLNFAVYNLYSRLNPYFIYFDTEGDLGNFELETKAIQVSLFPIMPSVTWNFKF